PIATKVKYKDILKNKIIEHFYQLTLDPDFQKASATYSQGYTASEIWTVLRQNLNDENLIFPVGSKDLIGAKYYNDHLLVIFPGLNCLENNTFILTSVVPLTGSQRLYIITN
ncbi:hypothetical protein N7539_003138, partial [Penicillium diatomitis]